MTESDYVVSYPGSVLRLCRFVEGGSDEVTAMAMDALDVLREAWEPLTAEALLYALEGEDPMTRSLVHVARPHRQLVKASVPAGVRTDSLMIDAVVATADELSRRAIEAWLADARRDIAAGDGLHGEWNDIFFRASRAKVGPSDWRSPEAEVRLRHEARMVVVPIERAHSGSWLSGPREPASDQPPVEVRLTNEEGFITLRLTRHYGYWLEPSEPAARRLDQLVERLRVMGWANEDSP